jgi:hypothetical protein
MNAPDRKFHSPLSTSTLPPRDPGQDPIAQLFNSPPFRPVPATFAGTSNMAATPFTGTALAGAGATQWGQTITRLQTASPGLFPLGANLLTTGRRADFVKNITAYLVGAGVLIPPVRVTKGLFAMGHTVELSLHESDALPIEAGGANRRPELSALAPDSTFLLGKRPHAGLSPALRGDLFSAPRAGMGNF